MLKLRRDRRLGRVGVVATSWSTNDKITDAHISATIQQILTKFSAVVTLSNKGKLVNFSSFAHG